ncbi:MAG: hypothetical protein L6R38_003507 [Xanthoria sp. 2 TBL-2021]|nr:MAG: hypothetical protein L6R38_003507 [Xanthoria sp. 2 TBL-2021]
MASSTEAEKYQALGVIGKGSFGIIRKVRRVADQHILCRKEVSYIKMGQKEREQLYSEFSILSSLRHPNIVAYYHRQHLKDTQDLHLYMEYCGGGDLSMIIKDLIQKNQYAEESFVWSIFSQLATALYRCHYGVDPPEAGTNVLGLTGEVKPPQGLRGKNQIMILHRDLKPDNVFLGEDNQVKLGDFGLSKLMQSHDFASTYVGTPYYMSPEICAAERYTLHSDIWSLGCVMYELCARKPPFDAKTHFHLVQKIKDGRVDSLPSMYSPELQQAIKSCLRTNPLQRPDTAALLSLPIMRLMRKEREVVEIGKALRLKEDQLMIKKADVEDKIAQFGTEKEKMRVAIDDTVRREWEVKARLAIDQQIQAEMRELQKKFEIEVQARVKAEVQQQLQSLNLAKPASPVSPEEVTSISSDQKVESDQSALTDLSSLSLDSPTAPKANAQPARRKRQGPLARSRTEFDSPMEHHLPAPSPMSIDCLSLSPRRNQIAAATSIPNSKNIFAAAAKQKTKLHPLSSSPKSGLSLDPAIMEDSEDDVPELSSPTRRPSTKAPTRPGLLRQKTAPTNRLAAAPTLFPAKKPPRIPSPTNILPTGSPVRKVPPKPASAGGDEMLKAVMARNMLGQGGQGGRTLVELAQARAGGTQSAAPTVGAKGMLETGELPTAPAFRRRESEVPVWDPEKDEMPSPFLVRGTKGMRKL